MIMTAMKKEMTRILFNLSIIFRINEDINNENKIRIAKVFSLSQGW